MAYASRPTISARPRLSPCALALLLSAAFCAAVAAAPAPEWTPRVWTDFPVRLRVDDAAALRDLLARAPVASFHREQIRPAADGRGLVWEPRVTEAEFAALRAAGLAPERLPDREREGRERLERLWAERAAAPRPAPPLDTGALAVPPPPVYGTHAEIGAWLAQVAVAHPAIADTFVWGTSPQGRELWGLVISDSVGVEEPEPEVRLSATIHGNEPPGMDLLLRLAALLVDGYGVDPAITALVDDTEIHIMPLHNPDGYAAGTRLNSAFVDLNRNFPGPQGPLVQQPENQAFIAYARAHSFALSANLHTGALVVNYPWDYSYDPTPDEASLIPLSLEYSSRNLPMYNGVFSQGITNGADWYVTTGGLSDWTYDESGCLDVTLELSDAYAPAPAVLDSLWENNRASLLAYVDAARFGVRGRVLDQEGGEPLAATVTVQGNAKITATDPDRGDYHRVLPAGVYTLTFSAPDHLSATVADVAVTWGQTTVVDVALGPPARGFLIGEVVDVLGYPREAQVTAYAEPGGAPAAVTTSDPDFAGAYGFGDLDHGAYRLEAVAPGMFPESVYAVVDGAVNTAPDIVMSFAGEHAVFADAFEQGPWGWTGQWALTADAHGGDYAMTDTPLGDSGRNVDWPCTMNAGFDLSLMEAATLSFWARWYLEESYDGVQLQVSADAGATWEPLATPGAGTASGLGAQTPAGVPCYDGVQSEWSLEEADLSPWLGEPDVRLRFVIRTDGGVEWDGFYFDDLAVTGWTREGGGTGVEGPPGAPARLVGVHPNPFNPAATVRFDLAAPGPVRLGVYDALGRRLRRLADRPFAAGEHALRWDGRDGDGRPLPAGVYLLRFEAGGVIESSKLVLVR